VYVGFLTLAIFCACKNPTDSGPELPSMSSVHVSCDADRLNFFAVRSRHEGHYQCQELVSDDLPLGGDPSSVCTCSGSDPDESNWVAVVAARPPLGAECFLQL
jgi:hypothetical protein